ncbi:MAG: hypothetical protein HQM16_12275 [Deltaproteobacteria bacterium]|nr:hypothetical protein [Deltaproteobacteria bacterium]
MTEHKQPFNPFILIATVFVIVFIAITALLLHSGTKPNVDKMTKPVAFNTTNNNNNQAGQVIAKEHTIAAQEVALIKRLTRAQCPICMDSAVPLCARCNANLRALSSTVFECPVCRQKTAVQCPRDHTPMFDITGQPALTMGLNATYTQQVAGYYCPVCGRTGPPDWTATGSPLCPYCRNMMHLHQR